jgi:hypothetical protein
MNTPATLEAEAVSKVPGFRVEDIARYEKTTVSEAIVDLSSHRTVPQWMDNESLLRARALFKRNSNGIGLTRIGFSSDGLSDALITRATANVAVATIESFEAELRARTDKSRTEVGSIDAVVIAAETYYGRPALRIKSRISGEAFTCVLPDELAQTTGMERNWWEVWCNRRVLVFGEIKYSRRGGIDRVIVSHITNIDPPPLTEEEIVDPNFTEGLPVGQYIEAARRVDAA